MFIQNVSDQEIQNTGSGRGQVLRYFWIFPRNQLFLHLPAQKYFPSFLITLYYLSCEYVHYI